MLPGIRGSLIAGAFLETTLLPELETRLVRRGDPALLRKLRRWWRGVQDRLGPASSTRAVLDAGALPLIELLGFGVVRLEPHADGFVGVLQGDKSLPAVALRTTAWQGNADAAWRDSVRAGRLGGARWGLIYTGSSLRLVDAARTWSRRCLDFHLDVLLDDERSATVMCALIGGLARTAGGDHLLIGDAVARSDADGVAVCASLSDGVLEALVWLVRAFDGHGRRMKNADTEDSSFTQSLTVVYRLLFLLFAEARDLVPTWHRVYRDAYTIEALCRRALERPRARGSWAAVQAISRLAHAGCRAGDLEVTAFNSRLFSPAHAPLIAHARIPDEVVAHTVVALATRAGRDGRRRIAYADLGVEQLGAVYERVLDYEPLREAAEGPARGLALSRTSTRRKATGTFYTPRAMTEFLVRRVLHPLVDGRSAAEILELRVLDPAMGSGAFLVAACRYLAAAIERALVTAGEWREGDEAARRRAELRRLVAQRCLYGVDRNPTAVQLARLSLWLTTLSADRPLTFLDHHLTVGDSLVGAGFFDLARPPNRKRAGDRPLPLFPEAMSQPLAASVLPARYRLALELDDSAAIVRSKERRLDALNAPGTPLDRWRTAADVWCAEWLRPRARLSPAIYADLIASLIGDSSMLPERHRRPLVDDAAAQARRAQCFHWELEFPEVFFDGEGRRDPDRGFDAVIGNPPWEALRADTGDAATRAVARRDVETKRRFFRDCGIYRLQGPGHANSYQLFLERCLQLVRRGGRLGLVLPSGLATDHGSGALRRALFDTTRIDRLIGFDNRAGLFPIHRDVRFVLLEATAGPATARIPCSFGHTETAWLEGLPDASKDDPPTTRRVTIARSLIEAMDPPNLSLPLLNETIDLQILSAITAATPALAASNGWAAAFGRELNASDDRRHFVPLSSAPDLLPVLEGKHLEPFRALTSHSSLGIAPASAARLLDARRTFARARIGYRNIASATNRTTLIAAMLPERVVTTHTVFCLKTPLPVAHQYCLLALLNSLVANYLVRLQVTTHVPAALMARLPVPRPAEDDDRTRELERFSRVLERHGAAAKRDAVVRVNTIAADLYGLTPSQYRHVVGTFPLLDEELRAACVQDYERLRAGITRPAVAGPRSPTA